MSLRKRPTVFKEPVQEVQEKRITRVRAYFTSYMAYEIPEGISLLSEEESEKCGYERIGAWWIRHGKLHYINYDGHAETLSHDDEGCDYKDPDTCEVDYDSEEE